MATVAIALFVFTNAVNATTRVKANNTTTLNQTGSWTGNVVPTSSDIGQWNNTSGPSGNSVSLGGDMTWQGIQIANNATAWITINGANTLTLGTSGFDMTASPFSVTMNCLMGIGGIQTWNVNAGMLLAVNAAISGSNATYSLTKSGSGTLYFNDNNTYSGQTIVSAGILAFSSDGGVKGGVYSYGTAAGTIVINNGGTVRLDTNDFLGAHTSVPVATVTINAGGTMASNVTFSTLNNLTLSGGTLQSNGGTSGWGSFGLKGTVTVNGTVTSNISTGTGSDNNVFVGTNTAGGTTTFNVGNTASSGDDLDVSSVLTNNRNSSFVAVAGGLIKTGAGTMMLSGANTFTGGVTISGGILKAGSTTALGDSGNTITINSGAALDVNDINLQGYTSAITINGQMDATDGAIFNSSGTQQINAIRAIALGSNASIGSNGGRFDIGRTYSGNTYITGNSHTLTKVGNNQVSVLTQSTGLTSIVVNGGILSGEVTNVFGGVPITVNSGGQISQWNTITLSDSIYLNGGTILGQFEYSNAFSSAWSGPIALAASTIDTLMADVSSVVNPITLSGKISGSGGLVKAGAGLDILSNTNNNFGGGLTINQGVLQLGASNVIPDGASAGNVTVNDTLDMHGYSEGINGLNGAGTGVVTSKASGTITLTVGNNNATSTYAGIIQNGSATSVALAQAGSGSLTLSGANTYSGGTNLSAGTLNINGTAAIGATASRLTIAGGTTIDNSSGGSITLANNNTQTWNGNFTFTGTQSLNMGTGAVTLGATPQVTVSSSTLTEGGVISGAYGLTKTGTGTLSLTAANSYTGVTTISGGILSVATLAPGSSNSGIGASGTGAANLVLNGGTLQFSGASSQRTDRNFTVNSTGGSIDASGGAGDTIGISGASTIASGSPTLTLLGSNTSNNTLSGVLGGALSLAKSGAGTWVVSGNNTYNGGTTISAGTLLVNNTSGSGTGSASVTANGGALGGTGTISGAVSVNSGATLLTGIGKHRHSYPWEQPDFFRRGRIFR